MEISGEFLDKLFIRSLKTEEASTSSASMLATPMQRLHFCPYYWLAPALLAVSDLELESTYSRRHDSL